jgi:hypothetical protein
VKRGKWKYVLIKYNIARNIDTASRDIKAFISFVEIAITNEGTSKRPKLEFMGIIGSQLRPTRTPEDMEIGITRSGTKQPMEWCIIVNAFSGSVIDEMGGGEEGLIPILKSYRCIS